LLGIRARLSAQRQPDKAKGENGQLTGHPTFTSGDRRGFAWAGAGGCQADLLPTAGERLSLTTTSALATYS
jgi:hypothetical protein